MKRQASLKFFAYAIMSGMNPPFFILMIFCSFLALSAQDFSTQLPPINAASNIEELELPELPLWKDDNTENLDAPYSAYLLPTPESRLVISLAPPEAEPPDEIKITPTLKE